MTEEPTTHDIDLDADVGRDADAAVEQDDASRDQPSWVRRRPKVALAVATAVSLLLALVTAYLVRPDDALPDDVAVEVNGTRFTETQLDERIQVLGALYGLQQPTGADELDAFRRDAAKSAAVSLLMDDAAAELDIAIADKAADDMLAKLISDQYPDGGRQAFVQALGTMGASEEQVLDEIKQQAIVARLFDNVTAGVSVTDDEVEQAFEARRTELATPEQRSIRNMVVESRKEATALLRLLDSGEPFIGLARTYSLDAATRDKGAFLGVASRDQLDPAYGTAAFAAIPLEPFGPVRTSSGWHVGLVERVVPAAAATYEQVEVELRQTLETEQAIETWRQWLAEQLASTEIVYADEFRPEDPTALPDPVQSVEP